MKKVLSTAVASLSVAALLGGSAAIVSAHGNNTSSYGSSWQTAMHTKDIRSSNVMFIDYARWHNQLVIDLSKVEVEKGTQADLKALAQFNIDSKTQQNADLKALRDTLTDNDSKPSALGLTGGSHDFKSFTRGSWGLPSVEDLTNSDQVDRAYIDVMLSLHGSMMPLGNAILMKSDNSELKIMVRAMINNQGVEIGQLTTWRMAWYPDAVEPAFKEQ